MEIALARDVAREIRAEFSLEISLEKTAPHNTAAIARDRPRRQPETIVEPGQRRETRRR
jgi:hypothetical protein